jgi:glycerophosphoryl diester phosphodiesterase
MPARRAAIGRLLALAGGGLVSARASSGAPGPAPGPGRAGTRIVAHRGGALLWPENSLRAFRGALALGADDLELDVHLTADGEVVVIHDPTLDRTTTGQGPVATRRLADLAGVRLREANGGATDEPVPSLGQVLDLLAPTAAGLLLEIKVGAGGVRHPGIEERVLQAIAARGLGLRVQVMAFEEETVARITALDPGTRTVLLIGRRDAARLGGRAIEGVKRAAQLGAASVGLDYRLIDADVVAAARATRLSLGAWTVNDEPGIQRMLALGVESITSDRPDLALRLAGRR